MDSGCTSLVRGRVPWEENGRGFVVALNAGLESHPAVSLEPSEIFLSKHDMWKNYSEK